MNATEIINAITEKANGFTSLYVPKKAGEHLTNLIGLGRVFPITKAQAKKVYYGGDFDSLYNTDVEQLIEPLMNKHGFNGVYKLTKSGRFCRLENMLEFKKALKLEFGF